MGSSGVEAVDRKQKIRDRYKGVDASELEAIPAKAVEGVGESTSVPVSYTHLRAHET